MHYYLDIIILFRSVMYSLTTMVIYLLLCKDAVLQSPQIPAGCMNAKTVKVYPTEVS